jgi:restriction system protein
MAVPTYDELFNPLLIALKSLGGSASITEQETEVARILKLTDKEIAELHRGNRTKLSYRLAWARNYLKRFGILENSRRGIWSLTAAGLVTDSVDKEEVKRLVKTETKTTSDDDESDGASYTIEYLPKLRWQDDLLEIVRSIKPDAFERLCQRLLRESGFIQVEVTGRSGDGGIDGKGVVRIGGILSFHVVFQCKRYKGSVSPSVIRDFRGASVGRADKGLIITTGAFTRDARTEAQRDGATPIDLIDGEELVEKLKELEIGIEVKEKVVEEVLIRREYFEKL